jgi:hypothetical protein
MTIQEQLDRAQAEYRAHPTNLALRRYLILKGRLGRWDSRMHLYYGVSTNVTADVKRFIARGYGRGLVPTSTTGGQHAPGSYHYQHRAADLGVRREEIGTAKGMKKLVAFQRAEFRRFQRSGTVELIGPDETHTVLRGHSTRLAQSSTLALAHDNHVHGAF